MSNFEYYQVKAIKCAVQLVQKWSMERLIYTAQRFCNAIDSDFECMREVYLEAQYDDCLEDVTHIASVNCGAFNLCGALHFLAGNHTQSEIYFQKHIHAFNRVTNRDSRLNDG